MSEHSTEIPTILRRSADIELRGVKLRVVALVARDYIETLQDISAVYERLATGGSLTDVPVIRALTEAVIKLPQLQARSLRYRATDGSWQPVTEEWVVDNLDAADIAELVLHIFNVNEIETILKNWMKARARVAGVVAGLKPLSASAAPSDAPQTSH